MEQKTMIIHTQYNPPPSKPYTQDSPNLMKSEGSKEADISYILQRFTSTGELPYMSNPEYGELPPDINTVLSSYKQLEHDQALKGATIDDLLKGYGEAPLQPQSGVTSPSGANAPLSGTAVPDPNGSDSEESQKTNKKRSGTASINNPT